MIEARGLHVRYGQTHVLRGVDLSIPRGEFLLIGGPSGGGKSTLAHALMGLIPQTVPARVEGRVTVAGLDVARVPVAQIATHMGLVFQNPATQLFNGTVGQEIAFGPHNLGLPEVAVDRRVGQALEALGIEHLRDRPVRRLSGGEQQRVAIAAALAMRPAALILDEPTANLDDAAVGCLAQALRRLHRREGLTLIVIEHRLRSLVDYADRLIWREAGRVVADGAPGETLSRMAPSPADRSPDSAPSVAAPPLVAVEGVTAGYGRRVVLETCSLTLRRGEFGALVGPNGAGKTTLALALSGLLRPQRGRIRWHTNGHRPRVGLLQQNALHQLVCDTVEQEVTFGPRNLGKDDDLDAEALLAQADLLALRHRSTQALSVGQQQRVALAATLATIPSLLILDEPTAGQDWAHLTRVMDGVARLNRAGQTVLLITHERRLVERYASRVWRLEGDGRCVSVS